MCSLAIRLWQQNDTVAQNKAAVDLTDTETPRHHHPPPPPPHHHHHHHVKVLVLTLPASVL